MIKATTTQERPPVRITVDAKKRTATSSRLATAGTCNAIGTFRRHGQHGIGISSSANEAVLQALGEDYLAHHGNIQLDRIITRALVIERSAANGRAIAAQDVASVAHGGALRIETSVSGTLTCNPIVCDEDWLYSHSLLAYDPAGERHHVPTLLEDLFDHPGAGRYVAAISRCACSAAQAIELRDIGQLADAITRYVTLFNSWSNGRFISQPVERMVDKLRQTLGTTILATKPPGAGTASSVFVLLSDQCDQQCAINAFSSEGWVAKPVAVAKGFDFRTTDDGQEIIFSAPHRLDFVGAADLGQDPSIGVDGVCCSVAIEPRSELILRTACWR